MKVRACWNVRNKLSLQHMSLHATCTASVCMSLNASYTACHGMSEAVYPHNFQQRVHGSDSHLILM